MFSETSDKNNHRASLLDKRQRMVLPSGANPLTTFFTKNNEDLGIRRKTSGDLKEKESPTNETENTFERSIGENLTNNCESKTNLERSLNKNNCKNESLDEKMNDRLENSTCEKVITPKLGQDVKPLDCDAEQDENSEVSIRNKPLIAPASNHQKSDEDRHNISQNKTSNVKSTDILLADDDYQSKRPKISLVSELYSDTDSDSSK